MWVAPFPRAGVSDCFKRRKPVGQPHPCRLCPCCPAVMECSHLWLLLLSAFVTVMRKVANTILEKGTAIARGSPRDLENDWKPEQGLRVVLISAPIP